MAGSDKVVFDVGGQRFSTTLQTLNRYPDSLLPAMCKDCCDAVGTGKEIHIDRSPEKFVWILEVYRSSGKQSWPPRWCLDAIEKELDFYQLPSAAELIPFHGGRLVRMEKRALKKLAEEICREMARVQNEILLKPFARFVVLTEIKDQPAFHAFYISDVAKSFNAFNLQDAIVSSKRAMQTMTTAGVRCDPVSLSDNHVSMLSELMVDLGLKVSLEIPAPPKDPPASLLRVIWNF